MNKYELKVRTEIEEWKLEESRLFSKMFNVITSPISWVVDNVIPNSVTNTVSKAIMGALDLLKDGAYWTYSDNQIINEAKFMGLGVESITDLSEQNIEKLDILAQKQFMSNKVAAAIEGAGLGMGGFALIAADIPALFTLSFRSIQQIGSCYGFNMQDPKMSMIIMNCLSIGSTTSAAAKSAALADMTITVEALLKDWTYKKIAETTQTGVFINTLKNLTKHFPKKIAENITKRKLAQLIPIIGAAVGGGFNYWFVGNATATSYMVFRELYLDNKYDNSKAIVSE